MQELEMIVKLLSQVSDNALYGIVIYMVLTFLKPPVIILTVGYVLNKLASRIKVEKQ